MSNKAKSKLSVCFLVDLPATDPKSTKAAYKEIGSQIIKFAEAIKIDPNAIIAHSVISDDPSDMKPVGRNVADPKMAELQTINKKVESGKSSLDKPAQPDTEPADPEPEDLDDEKPRVVAVTSWTPPATANPQSIPVTPGSVTTDEVLVKSLLSTFDRVTEKSKSIIEALVKNKDKELTIDEIAKQAKQEKISVNAWLNQSAPKAVEKTGRGVYRLNSAKIKIKG